MSSILIADPTFDLRTFMTGMPEGGEDKLPPILWAHNGKQAQLFLAEKKNTLSAIFLNPRITNTDATSVMKMAQFYRSQVPLHVIHEEFESNPFSLNELRKLGARSVLKKPIDFNQMKELIQPGLSNLDTETILRKSREIQISTRTTTDLPQAADFIAIKATDFLSGSTSLFDIFAKISEKRFVKLLYAGDAFEPERLKIYLSKGVSYFYIRRQMYEEYQNYTGHLAKAIVQSKKVDQSLKITQTLNHGALTLGFLKECGIKKEHIKYAAGFIRNVRLLVHSMDIQKNDTLKNFFANAVAYDHGSSVALLAGVLANSMEIEFEKPFEIIGVAALLHDIGLYQLPLKLQSENESVMTREEVLLYRSHPKIGADILSSLKTIEPGAIQAVEQHHMRKSGGFPEISGKVWFNRVAEIVGICDEFQRTLSANQDAAPETILEKMEFVLPLFSKQTAYTFRSTFFPKNKTPESSALPGVGL